MIFTQSAFIIFLAIVLPLYYLSRRYIALNRYVLLAASYLFYGWADWRFAGLLFLSSCFDFYFAIKIHESKNKLLSRKWLRFGIFFNLGILSYFKYFAFLLHSFNTATGSSFVSVYEIALPAGISFYTFQSMSYIIDVYRRQIEPTKSLSTYLLFVSFFPQLVAGPIERATHLLPQFYERRPIDVRMIGDGARLILAGFVMKVVVADNLSPLVDQVYASPASFDGGVLLLATVFFAFQIYCDFAGYSNIAAGLGKLMGFDIMQNFRTPYLASSLSEFWRRWHISLSTFFRDYVYHPLGGSRSGHAMQVRNIMIVFAISGLWHGANWTFLAWGVYHGVGLSIVVIAAATLGTKDGAHPRSALALLAGALATQAFVLVGWVFFRAASLSDAALIISRILDVGSYRADILAVAGAHTKALAVVVVFFIIDYLQRNKRHILDVGALGFPLRAGVYCAALATVFLLGAGTQAQFIYFRF